ncbi:MAG: ABC transporter substrate-binding protein, partial [Albidovulum sp.]
MQKSKTTFLATVASVGLIASVANAAETIKIGLAVPLTGDFAAYNEVAGAQCMAKMINDAGGINGQEIELLIQDTG